MLTLEKINGEIENIIKHGDNRSDIACLADLFVCRDAMQERQGAEPIKATGSEFAVCVNGRCFSEILPLLEELMETLKIMQPRLYDGFIRRLK